MDQGVLLRRGAGREALAMNGRCVVYQGSDSERKSMGPKHDSVRIVQASLSGHQTAYNHRREDFFSIVRARQRSDSWMEFVRLRTSTLNPPRDEARAPMIEHTEV